MNESMQPSTHPGFLRSIQNWIEESGEILLMVRFSHAGGNRSYEFFTSFDRCYKRLSECEPRTSLVVFRKPQLTLRGVVDDDFIAAALTMVPDGHEYLIAGMDPVQHGKASWLPDWSGENHEDLIGDLEDARGQRVAFGAYPDWLEDNENATSAIVPLPGGTVECGVY